MTRLLRRLVASLAVALALVAVAAPSGLAIPVDPSDGTPYHMPARKVTKKKKTQRANPQLSRCREQRHVRLVGCPVPG